MKQIELFPSLKTAKQIFDNRKMKGHVFVVPNLFLFTRSLTRPNAFLKDLELFRKMGRTSAGWSMMHLHETARLLLRLRDADSAVVFVNTPYHKWAKASASNLDSNTPESFPSAETIENIIQKLKDPSSNLAENEKYTIVNKFLMDQEKILSRDFLNASKMLLWMGLPLHTLENSQDRARDCFYRLIRQMVTSLPNSSMIGGLEAQFSHEIPSCTFFAEVHDRNYRICHLKDVERIEGLSREQMLDFYLLNKLIVSFPHCQVSQNQLRELVAKAKEEKRSMLPEISKMLPRRIFKHLLSIKKLKANKARVLKGGFVEGIRLGSEEEFRAKMIEQVPGLNEYPDTLNLLKTCFRKMNDLSPNWKLEWDFAKQNWRNQVQK